MLFNSNIFLFVFLPIVFAGFVLACRAGKAFAAQIWLAAASLVFYAWSGIGFVPLLLASITANYVFGRLLVSRGSSPGGRWVLPAGIAFNLALLGYFKYGGFLQVNLEILTGWSPHLPLTVLPVGISFYTFTQIAFLVDASRGEAQEYDFRRYALFVTFFPHLIAGPIIHHKEMMPQFARISENRKLILQNLVVGLVLLSIGLAKKCLIADPLGAFASPIFGRAGAGQDIHFFIAWAAAASYTMQIYFDFSGYSDMAIGLARIFGVRFPANFNSPYKARSIIDFWRRWHMTLSRFLRDYLYIPLGGNQKGPMRRYANLMIVMLIGGLWHGASWTFVLWGGLHGSYLLINHAWRHAVEAGGAGALLPKLVTKLAWPLTLLAVVVAWVTFRAPSFGAAIHLYRAMFLMDGLSLPLEVRGAVAALSPKLAHAIHFFAENSRSGFYIGLLEIIGAAFVALALPNSLQLTAAAWPTTDFASVARQWADGARDRVSGSAANFMAWVQADPLRIGRLGVVAALVCAIFFFLAVRTINAAAETEFLYFQF